MGRPWISTKYGMAFGLMALAAALVAGSDGPAQARVLAGWAALSFGMMAVAYLGIGPGLLGKRPDGGREPWAWPLLGPYFALNGMAFGLYRLASRRTPPLDRVAPNLWLGRKILGREARRAGMPDWFAVLDLAAEFAEARALRGVPAYRSVPVLDGTAPDPAALAGAVAWLVERAGRGPTLVHCALGHGRSATVAAAYLLATGRAPTAEAAMAAIRAIRPGVGWNPAQQRALRDFAPPDGP